MAQYYHYLEHCSSRCLEEPERIEKNDKSTVT